MPGCARWRRRSAPNQAVAGERIPCERASPNAPTPRRSRGGRERRVSADGDAETCCPTQPAQPGQRRCRASCAW
jgi:hypothetical protein